MKIIHYLLEGKKIRFRDIEKGFPKVKKCSQQK